MIKNIIITAILLVVPVFFIGLFLMSGYHSLKKLRDRCAASRSPAEYEQAAKEYDAERKRFPSILAALLFRFQPARPFKTLGNEDPKPTAL
jgi:hypothetical protein